MTTTRTPKELFDLVSDMCREEIPHFEVRYKDKSLLQKLIGFLIYPFNRRYMTDYITTIPPHVYFPDSKAVEENPMAWRILAHEYVHLYDAKNHPVMFYVRYLMPQLLGLLSFGAFLAFLNPLFLFCLVFLAAFAPWPSQGRTAIELRGYAMSIAMELWAHGVFPTGQREMIMKQFTGWDYYRMCADEDKMSQAIDEVVSRILLGEIMKDGKPYVDVNSLF